MRNESIQEGKRLREQQYPSSLRNETKATFSLVMKNFVAIIGSESFHFCQRVTTLANIAVIVVAIVT